VDESGMIRTQIGTHNRAENGRSTWETVQYHPVTTSDIKRLMKFEEMIRALTKVRASAW
jgi:hypothetical protein